MSSDAPRCVASWSVGDEPFVTGRERAASVVEHLAHRLRVAAAAASSSRGLVWLDSGGPAGEARSSILTAFPTEVRRLTRAEVDRVPRFLDGLAAPPASSAPGWLGFLAYAAVAGLEPVALRTEDDTPAPLASWGRHPTWYRHVRASGRLELWSLETEGSTDRPALDAWRHWADDAVRAPFDLTTPMLDTPAVLRQHVRPDTDVTAAALARASRSFDREGFRAAVLKVKEAIRDGEIFQAKLAHRIRVQTPADPFSVFLRLRRLNPSPFACFFEEDWGALVSNSPERLFCVRDEDGVRTVRARPIAGTRPRRPDPGEDARSAADLTMSAKERAEHTMLVDLARNDLGRVAVPGTVRVEEYQLVEPYSHVHHLVSDVAADVRADVRPSDLFRALFPGGTITGAPKLRSIEVIDGVEPVGRGPYTGSAGYIAGDGTTDLSILIRTLVVANGEAWLWAGAGIVADSDPDSEYEETLHKAQAMLVALTAAEQGVEAASIAR